MAYIRRRAPVKVDNIKDIDYKNLPLLKECITEDGKILSVRITRLKPVYQRKLASQIKIARIMGLLKYCDLH